jgi:hypothetical protein
MFLDGCAKKKYDAPRSAYDEMAPGYEVGPDGELFPDYYVLSYSQFNVAGRRQPTCPFEVLDTVQARSVSLDDTWEEDKAHATGDPPTPGEPYGFHKIDPGAGGTGLYIPVRLESKLLELLRQKAQRLDADAVVNIAIYPEGERIDAPADQDHQTGDKSIYKKITGIEKITGQAIRFTDSDCRH